MAQRTIGGAAIGGANPVSAGYATEGRRQAIGKLGYPPPTYPWDIPMPDYQLVQTSINMAPGVADPTRYPLRPEAAGWILSIEFTVIDPNLSPTAAFQTLDQEWGSTEKFVGVNWFVNTTSKTGNVFMPGTSVGGNAQFPKPFVYEVSRDDTLYILFKSLIAAGVGQLPVLQATIVYNMKSKDPYRR